MAAESYRKRDGRLAQQVFERERKINQSERTIDEMAVDLLAMQQPMATDLRFVLAVLKINADLERVGDLAVNIAQRSMDLIKLQEAELSADIPHVGTVASNMVRTALESFIYARADVAEQVLKTDSQLDQLNAEVYHAMLKTMHENPSTDQPGAEYAVDLAKPGARG